ncbi:FusB/FusC family EF-G-binding protein [Paenibacillus nasutitermitis]|uniref:Elongation factor G-binding protein n=1 Tax=Paenibacillus nasutitermitis TaxID=1652958 RepID=A0A916YVP3_9BACL|nr:FusB/FusC family EF-G-binding protein [Paenibacillus nasutitermitis]GGD63345.1 elongation factor G-binding protein [Paenibacillus nasutitermitis]
MQKPYIRNHQFNLIQNETAYLGRTIRTSPDASVIEAIRYSVSTKILAAFPELTDAQRELLQFIANLSEEQEFQDYLEALSAFRIGFPEVTEQLIRDLFPKHKKLKLPDPSVQQDYSYTYFGWPDIATNKMFLIYEIQGELIGIEGKYSLNHKKDVCAFCKGFGEVALFTANSRKKIAGSPDYYKAVGNYICFKSHECNSRITDPSGLERFFKDVREN